MYMYVEWSVLTSMTFGKVIKETANSSKTGSTCLHTLSNNCNNYTVKIYMYIHCTYTKELQQCGLYSGYVLI